MSELGTIKWGKAASQEMHLGGVYVCRICNMFVEHGSDDCPHSNPPKPAVPPAMQRASSEAQFNVVGDELRKLSERLEQINKEGVECTEQIMKDRTARLDEIERKQNHIFGKLVGEFAQLQQNQQLIMQKLEYGLATFERIRNTHHEEFKDACAWHITFSNSLQAALEERMSMIHKRLDDLSWRKAARKRQLKPVRPASKRKSTRKL